MPSFDVVSELDKHELSNALDQANREITTRYDFKGVDASFELKEEVITMVAEAEFQLQQMLEILRGKLVNRKIDVRCLEEGEVETANLRCRQPVTVKQGVDQALAKKIVKMIKDAKLKVQAQIQGEQVRVTGKKRDDLQEVIALLRAAPDIELPLQFTNFRD
ncbi:nucleotide-binding protein [Pokkaliibacter plantistimulans]|uniref:Nucleotide-binding protein WH50_18860 n=2 Tax=Pseudomonadota TaxID=1224 RepID=A0ABX5LWC5_9GAMM|nr:MULTISPECIES: YajQ family cyclic di-GMP-binding protein [Pokkaliibacter]MDH2431571.1 YajQ family cyclic di-GMP-binding protein [Pokkaliibacter sp. MBI-7]PPC77978.1 YajQ family cyclic di-GMP-binding protein [Pokkaliibacter plantistimulans]PXF29798.1 nucleotide-binding protein [Pokkaliibacter plantistimulans]